jgi:hypothetical protein
VVEEKVRRRKALPRGLLFLYGGLTHWLFLRGFVRLEYPLGTSRAFVDDPLTNAGVAVLGGIFVAWLLMPIVNLFQEGRMPAVLPSILRASGRAMLATALTLETFYIVASVFSAFRLAASQGIDPIGGSISFFIEIQTYGMIALALGLPFAVMYGTAFSLFLKILEIRAARATRERAAQR